LRKALVLASPYFASMLEKGWLESASSAPVLLHCSNSQAFTIILWALLSGRLFIDSENAASVVELANRYDFPAVLGRRRPQLAAPFLVLKFPSP
jgi:hypothetical protein